MWLISDVLNGGSGGLVKPQKHQPANTKWDIQEPHRLSWKIKENVPPDPPTPKENAALSDNGNGENLNSECFGQATETYHSAGYRIRRRRVGGKSLALTVEIADYFTESERAVLNMIANGVKQKGICDWCIDKIQRLAGVCKRTVQNAVKKACALGFLTKQLRPVPGRKNLTNILRIAIPRWKNWLKKMKAGFDLGIGCKPVHRTEDKYMYFSNNEDKTSNLQHVDTTRRWLMKGNKPDD